MSLLRKIKLLEEAAGNIGKSNASSIANKIKSLINRYGGDVVRVVTRKDSYEIEYNADSEPEARSIADKAIRAAGGKPSAAKGWGKIGKGHYILPSGNDIIYLTDMGKHKISVFKSKMGESIMNEARRVDAGKWLKKMDLVPEVEADEASIEAVAMDLQKYAKKKGVYLVGLEKFLWDIADEYGW
jgi:hypothetical protein